ncbi:hypothetical protein D3C85_435590 [compost metagenome]
MTHQEQEAEDGLNNLIQHHLQVMKDIEERHRHKTEFFEECLKIGVGGYVVLWVLVEAFTMVVRLPPYVA